MTARNNVFICLIALSLTIFTIPAYSLQGERINPADLCWDKERAQNEAPTPERFDEIIGELGMGTGFFSTIFPISSNITIIGGWTYHVPPEETSAFQFSVYSPQDIDNFRVLVFVNEEPFHIGEDTPYLDTSLSSTAKFNLDIELPALEEGIYEVVIVYGDNLHTTEPRSVGNIHSLASRFTVLVGEPRETSLPYQSLPKTGSFADGDPYQLLSLTLTDTLDLWSYPDGAHEIQVGDPLNFNILTGYFGVVNLAEEAAIPDPETARFALLMLVDYEQIPFAPEVPIIYGEVDQDTAYTRIPVTIPSTQFPESGLYQLSVMQINNPRVPMCELNGPDYLYSDRVTLMQVALEVEVANPSA